MLKAIGWFLKASLFAVVVLVASHFVKWNGKTVSDQVRSTLSSAEKSPAVKSVTKKSKALLNEAKDAAGDVIETSEAPTSETEIPAADKVELQALINSENERI